ncbi:hypothetical protein QR680_006417 [Steinernema hermaphroditum]|uniref:KOW domain-containing protein n=1 Tax=Steinernema hermaphroditum TaxID=289476 RepID=A0AA39HWM0_9BILA|nr:hypothetical protein QR680_006417 [Steinernema hermaphroditum]
MSDESDVSHSDAEVEALHEDVSGESSNDEKPHVMQKRRYDSSEEEEEEVVPKKRRKKKGRLRGCDFILDDVEVDDDDEDEAFDETEEFGLSSHEREEAERAMREQETMLRRARRPLFEDFVDNEDQLEQYFKDRYAGHLSESRSAAVLSDDVAQQSLMPTNADPKIWIVKCQPGTERMQLMRLLKKQMAHSIDPKLEPLKITSVVVRDAIKGLIYIEAFSKHAVNQAIEGISALNSYDIRMVPQAEMADTLRVVKKDTGISKGDFVRMKRTMYKDDLAEVDWVDHGQGKINVRLVPRIDYTRKRGELRDAHEQRRTYRGQNFRPPQALFDAQKIREIGGRVTNDGSFFTFEGCHYHRGYLYKTFPLSYVQYEGVNPLISEINLFQHAAKKAREVSDIRVSEMLTKFEAGDVVEVIEGELVGLRGVVQRTEGLNVVIFSDHPDLKEELTVPAREVRKAFKSGDSVKVTGGTYQGESGFVVSVKDNTLIIISHNTSEEMHILQKDAQISEAVKIDSGKKPQQMTKPKLAEVAAAAPMFNNGPKVSIPRVDKALIGKMLRIIRGPFKGYFGTCKDATEVMVRVELNTTCTTINVDRHNIEVVATASYTPRFTYGRTPAYGGTLASRTPAYGGQTPGYEDVDRF